MKTHADIRFRLHSTKELDAVFEALAPETKDQMGRARATLNRDGDFLILHVEARDTVALRSALNSYLRLSGSVVSVLQAL